MAARWNWFYASFLYLTPLITSSSIDVAHNLLSDGKDSLDSEDMPTAIQELSDACDIFAR